MNRLLEWLASPVFRLVALLLLVVLASTAAWWADGFGVAGLREFFEGLGLVGPLIFAVVYAVAATAMLPAAPFTIGAGLLFGPVLGTFAALLGATTGAIGGFLLGRALGRGAVEQFGGSRVVALDRSLARRGFPALLVARLVPLFPFNLVNLAAGVTGMALRDYVLATAVGIVPGTVVYAALGGTIEDPTTPAFAVALGAFIVVTAAAALVSRRLGRWGRSTEPTT